MREWTKRILGVGLAAAVVSSASVAAADDQDGAKLRWKDIVGLIQVGNLVGSGTGQVQSGGQPWSTEGGEARVNLSTGDLHFKVEGLVLAGGNGIGTRANIAQVKGTLVCDTDGSAGGGNSVLVDTPLVTLDEQGNAEFQGSVGPLPAVCSSQADVAFLIRIAAGRWIANGAVLVR